MGNDLFSRGFSARKPCTTRCVLLCGPQKSEAPSRWFGLPRFLSPYPAFHTLQLCDILPSHKPIKATWRRQLDALASRELRQNLQHKPIFLRSVHLQLHRHVVNSEQKLPQGKHFLQSSYIRICQGGQRSTIHDITKLGTKQGY